MTSGMKTPMTSRMKEVPIDDQGEGFIQYYKKYSL